MLIDNLIELSRIPDKDSLTATKEDVLDTETFIGASGRVESGELVTVSNQSTTLKAGTNITIAEGYHPGTEVIQAASKASQTAATATANNIENGYTGWSNGVLVEGTVPLIENKTTYLNCGESYTVPVGVHKGGGKVVANDLASQTPGNAVASVVGTGYSIWSNGTKVDGSMTVLSIVPF